MPNIVVGPPVRRRFPPPRVIFLLFLVALTSCNIVMVEEKYIAKQMPQVDGVMEIVVYADGHREPTEDLLIKEESPYQVRVLFRTRDTDIKALDSLQFEVPELGLKVSAQDLVPFGEPSANPAVAGYRFTTVLSSDPVEIDFDEVDGFGVMISYSFKDEQGTVSRQTTVQMKKKLVEWTEEMAAIASV